MSYGRLVPEHELKKRGEVIRRINKQLDQEAVLRTIREKQFPVFLAGQGVRLEELSSKHRDEILEHWSKRDYDFRILESLEKISENIEKMLLESRIKGTRRGQIFGNRFVLPATNPLVVIDLVNPENSKGLPAGVSLRVPRVPIAKMKIYNEGPTGRLLISTNEGSDSTRAEASIPPGGDYTFDEKEPVIEYLNLLAPESDITVNVLLDV